MEFLDPTIDAFVVDHSNAEPELLNQLNRDTHLNVLMPRMLSSSRGIIIKEGLAGVDKSGLEILDIVTAVEAGQAHALSRYADGIHQGL